MKNKHMVKCSMLKIFIMLNTTISKSNQRLTLPNKKKHFILDTLKSRPPNYERVFNHDIVCHIPPHKDHHVAFYHSKTQN